MPSRPVRLQYAATYSSSVGMPRDFRSTPRKPERISFGVRQTYEVEDVDVIGVMVGTIFRF